MNNIFDFVHKIPCNFAFRPHLLIVFDIFRKKYIKLKLRLRLTLLTISSDLANSNILKKKGSTKLDQTYRQTDMVKSTYISLLNIFAQGTICRFRLFLYVTRSHSNPRDSCDYPVSYESSYGSFDSN